MRVVKIKNAWNPKDNRLVMNDKITENGMTSYWCAVDKTFKFNVTCREAYLAKNFSLKSSEDNKVPEATSIPNSKISPISVSSPVKSSWSARYLDSEADSCQ